MDGTGVVVGLSGTWGKLRGAYREVQWGSHHTAMDQEIQVARKKMCLNCNDQEGGPGIE
jgi:hypothetical protein